MSRWMRILCARVGAGVCALALALRGGARAAAADAARRPTSRACKAEIDRLKQELREQRQLILQLMQAEQQRYDVVLKYLQSRRRAGRRSPRRCPRRRCGADRDAGRRRRAGKARRRRGRARPRPITGQGAHRRRPALGEAYVYVDGLRSSRARPHRGDQAAGQAVRAARGGGAAWAPGSLFPNQDTVIHNVFSRRPATRSTSGRSRAARRRRRSCCSSPARSRSSATSTRRCGPTSWWSPTATGRASRPTDRSSWPACPSARASWCSGARR